MVDSVSLANKKLHRKKLEKAGFVFQNDCYLLQQKIVDDEFLLTIKINADNVIHSQVVELETNEPYTLYNVPSSIGGFVGQMRGEYNQIVQNVVQNCSSREVYKSRQAQQIEEYIWQKYGDNLEFLWDDENSIARNKTSKKWYLVLMVVAQSKLGLGLDGSAEIVNVHLPSDKVQQLVDGQNYFGGYHMNKKYWLTVKLDGAVSTETILQLIDESYLLSVKK